ncbi:hypothetical protein M407DRAFT_127601 [Tulasnella calospora MUT 4182]|uniref:Uncharacterized protein n=1 Tax=Tulasnella calospora MUT 4182 TaxID=1051891 RepID=A0A0C3LJY7_9AGAM|nr:hypothetical protein M407DRAFT_127601 [Tulasnella calospora MUT 4182]
MNTLRSYPLTMTRARQTNRPIGVLKDKPHDSEHPRMRWPSLFQEGDDSPFLLRDFERYLQNTGRGRGGSRIRISLR